MRISAKSLYLIFDLGGGLRVSSGHGRPNHFDDHPRLGLRDPTAFGDLNLIALLRRVLFIVDVKHGPTPDVLAVLRVLDGEMDHDLARLIPQIRLDDPDFSGRAFRSFDFYFV